MRMLLSRLTANRYTSEGRIVVKLSLSNNNGCDEGVGQGEQQMLELKITDTGKGISKDYLRNKLYTRNSNLSWFLSLSC